MAVNAYAFVLAVDPASPEGMAFSDILLQMWQEMYPLRMGELFALCTPTCKRVLLRACVCLSIQVCIEVFVCTLKHSLL